MNDYLDRRCRLGRSVALVGLLLIQFTPAAGAAEAEADGRDRERILIVVGAGGTEEYAQEFADWAANWQALAQHRNWEVTLIGGQSEPDDQSSLDAQAGQPSCRQQLQSAIEERGRCDARLWVVMLGHGTAAGEIAKFNLPGPDVSAPELANWLDRLSCPVVVINCSSASGPFLPALSKPGRIVITATQSGSEFNFSRFGKFLAAALQDLSADLDHDLEVSLLEAFLTAVARTEEFYRSQARLATEHALLDDNGDGRGTSGEFFRGLRPLRPAAKGEPVDGQTCARVMLFASPDAPQLTPDQLAQRESIETRIDNLRERKLDMGDVAYYEQLEALLLELAALYEAAEM